ncbi:serine hydrolase domain-containing protein [Tenacibaculum agarivorans]|uniref:serine hydrolase domain-containing protein n=1 Tax=Tenacibaculum agarivorans TaxID=1908389 RepID=UPI00094B9615|nr:serine hydrolase domain-containing protein [Tenacibaculum agarivorans]
MKKLLLPILMLMAIVSCKHEKTEDETSKALTDELQRISQSGLIHGFSVAIVNEENILYQKGFGFCDIKKNRPYTAKTLQRIGSVSKVIIGLALLKAQELGKLQLDDPINKYLDFEVSNPLFPEENITIQHLATHTSSIIDTKFYDENVYVLKEDNGFNGINEMEGVFKPSKSRMPMSEFLKKILSEQGEWYLKEGFTTFKPGEHHRYTNIGSALAAYVLEKATGQSFPNFTKKYVFDPLKMSLSGWSYETVDSSLVSKQFYGNKEVPLYTLHSYPDGGLFSSSNNLGLLLKELIRGQAGNNGVLTKESYSKLFGSPLNSKVTDSIKKQNPVLSVKYDSCIFMGKTASGYFGHTGGDLGVVSFLFFDADTKIGRVLNVNTHVDGDNEKALNELWKIWNTLDQYKSKLKVD